MNTILINKILSYAAVLLVFSWVTTANAIPVASISNLNGFLKIDGFSSLPGDGDRNPLTIDFLFDYRNGGTGNVNQAIVSGNSYNITVGGAITGLGPFNANFNIISPNDFDHIGSASVDTILGRLLPSSFFVSGSPLGTLTVPGNTLDLLSVTAGQSLTGYTLKLATKVIRGETLIDNLNRLDGRLGSPANGSVTVGFTDVNLNAVPEPTVLMLLGSGLLGMIGISKKRA